MAVMNAKTLVLRGVAVLRDGVAVGARKGFGTADLQKPAPAFSMRHTMPSCPQTEPDGRRPDAGYAGASNAAAQRAGRPGSHAGALRRHRLATTTARTIPSGWALIGRRPLSAAWSRKASTRGKV